MRPAVWQHIFLIAAFFFTIAIAPSIAQAQISPSTTQASSASAEPEDNFAPALFVVAILFILVVLLVVGVGLAIGVASIALFAALILLGVVSTSVLVGVHRRRFESGAKALLIQLAAVGGAIAGAVAFWITAWMLHLNWQTLTIVAGGGTAGLVVGVVVGLALNSVWIRVRAWIISRRPGHAFEVVQR